MTSTAAAVRHHYDVGNDFYRLWLDPGLTYSCALPEGPDDGLAAAQARKVALHLDAVGPCPRLLDVGCGWGGMLDAAVRRGTTTAVGLTLAQEQAAHVRATARPGVEVRVEDWTDHVPDAPYDGIVSVGALEHFARPEDDDGRRVGRYRDFLARCRDWLAPGGVLSLQTIAYGSMDRADASAFIQQEIFPAADLPSLLDLAAAADGLMEIRRLRDDPLDYAWTCERWAANLRARRAEAVALVGEEVTARYERYLRQSALGFRMGRIGLLRLVLAPRGRAWTGTR
ncbi:SAM-dependent methyltransferase [Actinomycetospora chiangmaiensis]|uniref:SAM-dependent methyltransferase n=1 Tax=Actinomycetospora chiangmaiensis TaxID=402650 RepID=UPI00036DC02D|nr:cyclopropane-fatty-acyl-phospholipid synthase family protein [Actinomycetospora chiangmaiensis]